MFLNLINTILVSRYHEKFDLFNNAVRPSFEQYFAQVEKLEQEALANPTPLDKVEIEIQKRCEEKGLVDFVLDTAMIKYWKHGIIRHFKPRLPSEVLKMTDAEIKVLPEFRLAVADFLAKDNLKRERPWLSEEIARLETHLVAEFRKEISKMK